MQKKYFYKQFTSSYFTSPEETSLLFRSSTRKPCAEKLLRLVWDQLGTNRPSTDITGTWYDRTSTKNEKSSL